VTIFDRRSIGPDTIHLYYTSFYLQSHRFHTKHVLIYSCIEEEKGKDNKIGIKVQHTARSKDKVRKGQSSRIQHALNWGRYTPGSKLDALPSVRNIKREKKPQRIH